MHKVFGAPVRSMTKVFTEFLSIMKVVCGVSPRRSCIGFRGGASAKTRVTVKPYTREFSVVLASCCACGFIEFRGLRFLQRCAQELCLQHKCSTCGTGVASTDLEYVRARGCGGGSHGLDLHSLGRET